MLTSIFILLVAFQLAHFLADFPLQNRFMLGKFSRDPQVWISALTAHAAVHMGFTAVIVFIYFVASGRVPPMGSVCALAGLDFVTHFIMDRIKADPDIMGRFKALSGEEYKKRVWIINKGHAIHGELWDGLATTSRRDIKQNTYFWWCLGFDQMVHHLTHYAIIYILLTIR